MSDVTMVEVAPRDGFQAVADLIPTARKIEAIAALSRVGFQRMEIGAFVSPAALPQMADIRAVIDGVAPLRTGRHSALVPNRRGAEAALAAGITELVYVLSVSEAHNRANVSRSPQQSLAELAQVVSDFGPRITHLRVDLATSFDCPFDGPVAPERTLALAEAVLRIAPGAEICFCDTTGRAFPREVGALFGEASRMMPRPGQMAFHAHDTYGFAIANILAAHEVGVRVFDAAAAGLGGCPFAPGATGNVATEDAVFALERLGVRTGLDFEKLLEAADCVARLQPGSAGGHIRVAPRARMLADALAAHQDVTEKSEN